MKSENAPPGVRSDTKMSVFGDFQQVWSQRFPHSSLPDAWEEDIRANLAKHKQKITALRTEIEKEEIYVEYLERLISDIEQNKKPNEEEEVENDDSAVESIANTDSLSKVNSSFLCGET